ncbi:nibrin-like [Elysia marginata]|uniref:Nibrin-like n=1 Tax=Elysia marginata TaxID=1093978 RepID=A0AAV4JM33_9GAST|nr:nibrin-like [Elysia marginata]
MFSLLAEKNAHSILGDHKYVVGRQNCDIVVADPSVSRKQAVLTMAHYETNVAKSFVIPTLTLEDVSKFGTYVNGKAVKTAGGNTITLKENDHIKFGGTPASVYRARYQPFLATTSCLEKGPKKALQSVMCLLGGHLVRDWRPTCDLLIMSKINVTLKVICAINNQKHIVTPKYLDDVHQHLMGRADKPDPEQYLPEVVDQEVPPGVSFHPDKRRQTLLKGLKFYFLSPLQFNKTNLAVSTAGGQPILLEDGNEEDAEAMTHEGTVVVLVTKEVMDTLSPASTKFVRTVMATLKRKNLRMITDPEIGTAILTCNMVDYCNPRAALAPNLQAAMASQIMSQMIDMDSSQTRLVPAAFTSQDIKPQIRSSPGSSTANVEPQRKTGSSHENIVKPEKSSRSDNGAIAGGDRNLTLTKPDSVDTLVATAAVNTPGFVAPKPEIASPRSADANKAPDAAKGGSGNKPARVAPSQMSNDLFCDVSAADESPPKSPQGSAERVPIRQTVFPEDDKKDDVPSVFARQRIKRRGNFALSGVDEDENTMSSKNMSDEDEDIDRKYSSKTKNSFAPKRKFLFDDDSDEEISHRKAQKRNQKSTLGSRHHQEGNDRPGKGSELDVSSSLSASGAGSGEQTGITCREKVTMLGLDEDSVSRDSKTLTNLSDCESDVTDKNKSHSSLAASVVAPTAGWVRAQKRRTTSQADDEDEDNDVKPDVELLRDTAGNVLRNLCHVEVAELVVRQPKPKSNVTQGRTTKNGTQKNFKMFKKTENAGAGKLPTIIGGRDLEEHTGNVHKDLEDLFTKGLARQNEQDEEERQNRDLFDWDTKSRKTSNRRIR